MSVLDVKTSLLEFLIMALVEPKGDRYREQLEANRSCIPDDKKLTGPDHLAARFGMWLESVK